MYETNIQKNLTPEQIESIKLQLVQKRKELYEKFKEFESLWNTLGKEYYFPYKIEERFMNNRHTYQETWNFEREIDKSAWEYFFGSANLQDIMSASAIKKYNEKLADPAPFTADLARSYIANSFEIAKNSLNTLLKEVFDRLIQASYKPGGKWKCNIPSKKHNNMKIEKSFRCSESLYVRYGWWDYAENHPPIFNDLEKICCILDRKKPAQYPNTILDQCLRKKPYDISFISNEYFDVRLYKNGNQSVKFKRLDILELLNRYGASGELGYDVKVQVF